MKKTIKYTFTSIIVLSLIKCTSDFGIVNTNPDGITTESLKQMNNLIGGSFAPMFLNVFNITPTDNYQLQQGLIGDVYSGYMASPNPFRGNVNNMTYSLVDGWNGFPWSDAYTSIMPFVRDIKNAVAISKDSSANKKFVHLANIVKVMAMHRVSDIYGPIRYTKYDDFATTKEYDSQKVAYDAFFTDLGTAIDGLKQFEDQNQFEKFDMSNLEGNIAMWRKFANSLRLRLALRIVNIDPTLAKTQGELALVSDAGFLETKDMVINTGFAHPITIISGAWDDVRMSAEMESILTGYNDGRIKKYFNPSSDKKLSGAYKGIRMGVKIDAKTEYVKHSSIGSVIEGETIIWMTSSEVYFLRAEAALRNWVGAENTKEKYEKGVIASFTQHGIPNSSDYLADNTSTPADFVDAINSANDIVYPNSVKIEYNTVGTQEEKLEQIITQKWIAMFPDGQEAWSEFRRTGYPKIFPVVVNNSGGNIDTNVQIRRINFPRSEKNTNATNVKIAVDYLSGPDNGGTRLWWDVAGSNF